MSFRDSSKYCPRRARMIRHAVYGFATARFCLWVNMETGTYKLVQASNLRAGVVVDSVCNTEYCSDNSNCNCCLVRLLQLFRLSHELQRLQTILALFEGSRGDINRQHREGSGFGYKYRALTPYNRPTPPTDPVNGGCVNMRVRRARLEAGMHSVRGGTPFRSDGGSVLARIHA